MWRYDGGAWEQGDAPLLYDVEADPGQLEDLAGRGLAEEERMRALLVEELRALRVPEEQFERLGL